MKKAFLLSFLLFLSVTACPFSFTSSVTVDSLSLSAASNGYEYVNLGLPSGLLWAACNVGASSPEDYGFYFEWGDTVPMNSYIKGDSVYGRSYGKQIDDFTGVAKYDAARAIRGGEWRMPTNAEFKELCDNCNWTWTRLNGVKGYRVVSKKNGNSIFLPAAGTLYNASFEDKGYCGSYWTSTPIDDDHLTHYKPYTCYKYSFSCYIDDEVFGYQAICRIYGLSVRPVMGPAVKFVPSEVVFIFDSAKNKGKVDIKTNISWMAECSAGWVKLKKRRNTLFIKVEENISDTARKAKVYLRRGDTGDITDSITVYQKCGQAIMR